jgi:hypothetical protein
MLEIPMANAWTENGPISLPPRSMAYGAGLAVVLFAALGMGLGLEAAVRRGAGPDLDTAADTGPKDDALIAKPIVDMTPPAAAPAAAKNADDESDDEDAKSEALAEKTAEAQAIQAKASRAGANIDDVLASPTERPPAPVKTPTDEAPPGAPVKTDVPF